MRSSSVRDKRPFSLMTPRLLVVEGLLARGLYFGIQVGLPQAPRHAGSPARYLCLAGTSPRGPWNYRVVHAKLLHCSLDLSRRHLELFFGFSSFVCAHNETLVSWTVLGLNLTCWARFQHRTSLFSAPCDQSQLATAALLVVTDDLIGLPVGCPQRSCRMPHYDR